MLIRHGQKPIFSALICAFLANCSNAKNPPKPPASTEIDQDIQTTDADIKHQDVDVKIPVPYDGKPVVFCPSITNQQRPTCTWSSAAGNTVFRFQLDNSDLKLSAESTDLSFTSTTNLTEGPHTLYVQEKDDGAYWSEVSSATFTIDLTPPAAPLIGGPQATASATPKWTWTSGGGGNGSYRLKVGDSDMSKDTTTLSQTSFTSTTALSSGSHSFFIQERDEAGNWSAVASINTTVNLTALPAPEVTGTAITNSQNPEWTWKSAGGTGTFRFLLDSSNFTAATPTSAATSFQANSTLAEGDHTLYVQEFGINGLWSLTGSFTTRVDITPPNKPLVTGVYQQPCYYQYLWFYWQSGGGGGSGQYRIRYNNFDWTARQLTYLTCGEFVAGTYQIQIQERDIAGNWSVSGTYP